MLATVETMNIRIISLIKILQPLLGWQNLDRTTAYTRFHRIKGGGGVPPPTNNFDRVDDIHKISSTLSKVIRDGGGGEALHLRLLFCNIVCHH